MYALSISSLASSGRLENGVWNKVSHIISFASVNKRVERSYNFFLIYRFLEPAFSLEGGHCEALYYLLYKRNKAEQNNASYNLSLKLSIEFVWSKSALYI
jgi:hypothetical protein